MAGMSLWKEMWPGVRVSGGVRVTGELLYMYLEPAVDEDDKAERALGVMTPAVLEICTVEVAP